MCHNSGIESEQQIERYMAFGMPQKAIKTVKYTLRKRELKARQKQEKEEQKRNQQEQEQQSTDEESSSSSSLSEGEEVAKELDLKEIKNVTVNNTLDNNNPNTNTVSDDVDVLAYPQSGTTKPEATKTTEAKITEAKMETSATTTTTTTTANKVDEVKVLAEPSSALSTTSKVLYTSSDLLKIPKLCGRYRKIQQALKLQQQQENQQSISETTPSDLKIQQQRKLSSMEPSMDDALAIGTQMTRKVNERLHNLISQLQESRLYTILTQTTQPAHLIAICILSFVLIAVGPDLMENQPTTLPITTTGSSSNEALVTEGDYSHGRVSGGSTLPTLAYLGAFATHFGSQIWMTFVSGLSLYFSLPRHTFGQCQQILFPKYFALNAMLSISMLIIYVKYFLGNWTTASGMQLGILALTAAIEVVVRLYLAPPMLRLMHEKYKIEDAIGSGQEVGSLVQGDLVQCPHYQRIHKAFRRIHMTIAIGNMIILMATCLQLYFLASKIRIS